MLVAWLIVASPPGEDSDLEREEEEERATALKALVRKRRRVSFVATACIFFFSLSLLQLKSETQCSQVELQYQDSKSWVFSPKSLIYPLERIRKYLNIFPTCITICSETSGYVLERRKRPHTSRIRSGVYWFFQDDLVWA